MKLFGKLASGFDQLLAGMIKFTGILILMMTALISINITMRTVVGRSIPGTIEMCEWILLLIPFLGAAWLYKEDGHVRMDLIIKMLNKNSRCIINIITSVVVSLVCLLFFWFIGLNTWKYYITGAYRPTILALPTYIFSGIMAAGFLLIAVQVLRNVVGYTAELRQNDKELNCGADKTNYTEI